MCIKPVSQNLFQISRLKEVLFVRCSFQPIRKPQSLIIKDCGTHFTLSLIQIYQLFDDSSHTTRTNCSTTLTDVSANFSLKECFIFGGFSQNLFLFFFKSNLFQNFQGQNKVKALS